MLKPQRDLGHNILHRTNLIGKTKGVRRVLRADEGLSIEDYDGSSVPKLRRGR